MLRLLLMLSVTLNLLLLTTMVAARVDAARANAFAGQSGRNLAYEIEIPADVGRAGSRASASSFYDSLRAKGLTVEETKPLVLFRLEAFLLEPNSTGSVDNYWAAGMGEAHLQYQLNVANQQAEVRAALVDIYGADSATDPAFRRVFRPLHPRLDFLTPQEHAQVQLFQLEDQLARAPQQLGRSLDARQGPRANFTRKSDHHALAENLESFLGPASVTEYLVRYSPLAAQMRLANVEFSEADFRAAFNLLEQLEFGLGGPEEFVTVRASLRALLGSKRFTQLWAVRDPMFAPVESLGQQHGLTAEQVLSAYEIINDTQELMFQAANQRGSDPELARKAINDARGVRLERLSGLLGAAPAEELLLAHAQAAVRMSQGQSQ